MGIPALKKLEIDSIKPCPFCGNIPEVIFISNPRVNNPRRNKYYSVYCSECNTYHGYDEDYGGQFNTKEGAATSWNKRVDDND